MLAIARINQLYCVQFKHSVTILLQQRLSTTLETFPLPVLVPFPTGIASVPFPTGIASVPFPTRIWIIVSWQPYYHSVHGALHIHTATYWWYWSEVDTLHSSEVMLAVGHGIPETKPCSQSYGPWPSCEWMVCMSV